MTIIYKRNLDNSQQGFNNKIEILYPSDYFIAVAKLLNETVKDMLLLQDIKISYHLQCWNIQFSKHRLT
jgi:hypothetical protein